MRVAAIRTEDITVRQWELLYQQLSETRRRRADGIRSLERHRESIAAGALLESLLRHQGVPEPFSYRASSQGKPYLDGKGAETRLAVHFSVTHTKGLAAVAVGEMPVGVDAERIRPYPVKVAERYFPAAERTDLARGDDAAFYRVWTGKEALAKLMDIPLLEVLRQPEAETENIRRHTWQIEDWIITLCEEKGEMSGEEETCIELLTAGELLL